MHEEAERERRRERRRRLKRLQAEGLAIRLGAREVMPRDHSRGHSRRHHRDRRHGFQPIVTTADVGHGAIVAPVTVPVAATTTHAIPVARSISHSRHRHHSSGHGTPAGLVHVHSRSHSGSATPVVQVAHSQYTNAAPVAVSRAASSRRGHTANEYYDDRVMPVMRSSSRHGSARYGDPAFSRASSSRHGHGHYRHARTHSRTPSEVYVAT